MYPEDIRGKIVELLAGESLKRICEREGMPSRVTVRRWMNEDPAFESQCARAREDHAEDIFDEMAELEDQVLAGEVKADAARVVIASRQWRLEKLKHRKFGPKVDLNHSGEVKYTKIERVIVGNTDAQDAKGT